MGFSMPSSEAWGSELPSFTLMTIIPLELRAGTNRAFSCLNYSTILINFIQAKCVRSELCKRVEEVLQVQRVLGVDCRR